MKTKMKTRMKSGKTNSLVAIALASTLALASCNQSDDIAPKGPQPIRFAATIGEQAVATPQTRASGTNWHQSDAIGVFMLKNKETSVAATYAGNKKFTVAAAGLFVPLSGHEIYYPLDEKPPVDFIAYYPYKDTDKLNMDSEIDVITTDQSRQPDFDMMWAKADNSGEGYNKNYDDNIPLTFSHSLARLTMNIKAAANTALTDLNGMVVTINGMNTATTLAVKDGSLSAPSVVTPFTARKTATSTEGSYLATYDAIIVPATYASGAVTVTFTVQQQTFTWTVDAVEFASGYDYKYEVTLNRIGVKATGTINPWITVDKGQVWAE